MKLFNGLSVFSFFLSVPVLAYDDMGRKDETLSKTEERTETFEPSSFEGIIPGDGTLGTKIKDGTLDLTDMVDLVFYWIDYGIYIIGSLAILMIIYGGYQYVILSAVDEKERGKKTAIYASVGVFLSLMSWTAVNWLQTWLTH